MLINKHIFNLEKVTKILEDEGLLEDGQFGVSVMATFNYRAQEPKYAKRAWTEELLNTVNQ